MSKDFFIPLTEDTSAKLAGIRGFALTAGSLHQAIVQASKLAGKAKSHLDKKEKEDRHGL